MVGKRTHRAIVEVSRPTSVEIVPEIGLDMRALGNKVVEWRERKKRGKTRVT